MIKKLFSVILLGMMIYGCASLKNKKTQTYDFDQLFGMAQDYTLREKYQKSIDILNSLLEKYAGKEELAVTYNLGYNYYMLKMNEEAKKYLNLAISQFESAPNSEAFVEENRKYVILSETILEQMKKDIEDKKDPYHINEDIEKNRKLRPKINKQKPIIEK